jgi:hypothetical protein
VRHDIPKSIVTGQKIGAFMKLKKNITNHNQFYSLFCPVFSFYCPNEFSSRKRQYHRCSSISLDKAAKILVVSIDDLQKSNIDIIVSPDDIKKNGSPLLGLRCG